MNDKMTQNLLFDLFYYFLDYFEFEDLLCVSHKFFMGVTHTVDRRLFENVPPCPKPSADSKSLLCLAPPALVEDIRARLSRHNPRGGPVESESRAWKKGSNLVQLS